MGWYRMSWFNIFKAFTQEQVLNAWIELRQYLEITCGIYDIDYGEPENLYSIAGRMQELKEIILGEEGDIGKQFSKIEDYTDNWPSNSKAHLKTLMDKLQKMLDFREDNI